LHSLIIKLTAIKTAKFILFWRCETFALELNKKVIIQNFSALSASLKPVVAILISINIITGVMATAVTIPLPKSRESLVVQINELNEDIISILRGEDVDLKYWLECGRGLLSQGRVEAYERLLKSLIDEARRQRRPPQPIFIHVQALCSLADLKQQQARLEEDPEKKRLLLNDANKLYFDAQKVDHREILPHLGLGELSLSKVCFFF
jgi:hypothetical protein